MKTRQKHDFDYTPKQKTAADAGIYIRIGHPWKRTENCFCRTNNLNDCIWTLRYLKVQCILSHLTSCIHLEERKDSINIGSKISLCDCYGSCEYSVWCDRSRDEVGQSGCTTRTRCMVLRVRTLYIIIGASHRSVISIFLLLGFNIDCV